MSKRLVYNKLGYMGRNGNQMFQVAALYGMSKRFGMEMVLPEWKYSVYFKDWDVPEIERGNFEEDICECRYEFCDWQYWEEEIAKKNTNIISVSGWLQSSKYWKGYKEGVKKLFSFRDDFKALVLERNPVPQNGKETILVGFRVGSDYILNGNYEMLPVNYQLGALYKYFPDWRENYNILVFADDIEYAKLNMDCSDNIYFVEKMSDVAQLCLGVEVCDHFIIPNSTFSWWQAYLGQKEGSKVIRPNYYFKNYLAKISTTLDFWEEEWLVYDHKKEKFDLRDVTFCIPVNYDHKDRLENLDLTLKFLKENFDTNIKVYEQGGLEFLDLCEKWGVTYYPYGFKEKLFHRTKMLNDMTRDSITPYIVNYDADNIAPVLQILIAVDILRKEEGEMIYPYDGRCARVNREKYYWRSLENGGDCGIFNEEFRGARSFDPKSVGHIIFWNKDKYWEVGGENENFISYGPEDVERYERAEKLGVNIQRVKGITYHMDHYCGPDSSGGNPYFGKNYEELERIRGLAKAELQEEIKGWKWKRATVK